MSRLNDGGARLRPSDSASQMIRVHRIPYSTNVERVALAAGIKGIDVEWVEHAPVDRTAIVALSGQELVPVAEIDGEVVADSMFIVERLERLAPEPALYPEHPASRAMVAIFLDWFNEVWKARRTRSTTSVPSPSRTRSGSRVCAHEPPSRRSASRGC